MKKAPFVQNEYHNSSRELFFAADIAKELKMTKAKKEKEKKSMPMQPVLAGKRKTFNQTLLIPLMSSAHLQKSQKSNKSLHSHKS